MKELMQALNNGEISLEQFVAILAAASEVNENEALQTTLESI